MFLSQTVSVRLWMPSNCPKFLLVFQNLGYFRIQWITFLRKQIPISDEILCHIPLDSLELSTGNQWCTSLVLYVHKIIRWEVPIQENGNTYLWIFRVHRITSALYIISIIVTNRNVSKVGQAVKDKSIGTYILCVFYIYIKKIHSYLLSDSLYFLWQP